MFFDWNHNCRKDDSFDNMMDFMMISEMEKDEKKRRQEDNSNGTGGGCLMMLIGMPLWLPVAIINTFLNR